MVAEMCSTVIRRRSADGSLAGLILAGLWLSTMLDGVAAPSGMVKQVAGGDETKPGEFPFMAHIFVADPKNANKKMRYCAGTIFDERYILTAGHCLIDRTRANTAPVMFQPKQVSVELGCHQLDNGHSCVKGSKFQAKGLMVHSSFEIKGSVRVYDIGLIKLRDEVKFNGNSNSGPLIAPVSTMISSRACLAPNERPGSSATTMTIVGWGEPGAGRDNKVLRRATVPTLPFKECKKKHSAIGQDREICAGDRSKNVCHGDGGSPLLKSLGDGHYLQVGVSSGAPDKNCSHTGASVYTSVGFFYKWIKECVESDGHSAKCNQNGQWMDPQQRSG